MNPRNLGQSSPISDPQSSPESESETTTSETPNSYPTTFPRHAIKPKSIWPALVLVMAAMVGFVGWRAFTAVRNPIPSEEETADAGIPVRVVAAKTSPIQGWITSDGQVQATRGKHLTFEANGEITFLARIGDRFLREGDFVRRGQLLARIDDRAYRSNIRANAADVVVSQQSEQQATAGLAQAKADLEAAKADLALAESEVKRRQELYDEGVISASELDQYKNNVTQAEARVKVAQQSVYSAEDDIEKAKAQTTASVARLQSAQIDREDTQLISPMNGIVAFLNIREGDYWTTQRVQASGDYQSIVESVPIIVVDPNELEVDIELPAFQGERLRPGQQAYIVPDERMSQASVSGLTYQTLVGLATARGVVFSVNPAVTPGGRATEVRVRIAEGAANLRVGAKVSTWIEAETNPSATVLPFGSFIFRDRVPYVFVADGETGRVEQRQVVQGIQGLNASEVRSGVAPGELVVTEGRNRLVDGAAIEIVDRQDSFLSPD